MTAWRAWVGHDARRRWRSVAVLAVLLAVGGGVVLSAFIGARRDATAIPRQAARVHPTTAAALPNDGTPIRLVVDFSDVNLISSTLLSKLILLQRRIDGSHGKMRLCELSPVIQQVFRTSNLDRLFRIDRDQRTALDSFH